MLIWHRARKIANRYLDFVKLKDYLEPLVDLSADKDMPKYATHLVYLTKANNHREIEHRIIDSILNLSPIPKPIDVKYFKNEIKTAKSSFSENDANKVIIVISDGENHEDDAIAQAKKAKEEMARLTSENESLLKQARAERDVILKEAKTLKDQIVAEAKTSAQVEGAKLIEKAKQEIDSQKTAALAEVKNQVASLSLEIAEKVLNKQFEDQKKQETLVNELLKEVKL